MKKKYKILASIHCLIQKHDETDKQFKKRIIEYHKDFNQRMNKGVIK